MKCTGFALAAMIGFAYAAPVQESWIQPGGAQDHKSLTRRRFLPKFKLSKGKDADGKRIIDPIDMLFAGTAVSILALPLGTRFYNNLLGVQESDSAVAARARIEKDAADAKAKEAAAAAAAPAPAKRSIDVDAGDITFDETRKLFISSFVDTNFKNNPNDGETDAAVCTATAYKISDPSKTLDIAQVKFTRNEQESTYDCFILAGPVTFEVFNATDSDFVWEAPEGATFSNGVLTIV